MEIVILVTCMAFAFWCGKAFAHDRFAELRILLCEQSEEIQLVLARLDSRQIRIENAMTAMYYEVTEDKEEV